jgi:hypothetical protein
METIKFINTIFADSVEKTPTNIRSAIYKKGVLASYSSDGRMVLYTSKNDRFSISTDENVQSLWMENNGLVLDTNTMKPLVIPLLSFRSNVEAHIIDTYLSQGLYETYLIEDGTIINLYYWEPLQSWRISTTRGYDMTENKWGDQTYASIMEELLALHDTQLDDFYNSLDRNHCYTFGFKHGSMHPFQEGLNKPINKLWFIQSVNLSTYEIFEDFQHLFSIPNQTKYAFLHNDHVNTKTLFNMLHNCLDKFLHTNHATYGFILKSKNPSKTKIYSHILLESSLLQKIRQLYYHSNHNNNANEMNYNRETYIIIHSYLNINVHYLFIRLFPQYETHFKKLDTITTSLVKSILEYSKKNVHYNKTGDIDKISKFLYEKINNDCRLTQNKYTAKIVSSYILNIASTDLYYKLFMSS